MGRGEHRERSTLPSRSARKSWRFRTPLVRWRCAASLCEVFVPCVPRSAGVSGRFCFGCLGRSGSWSHWWCGGSWRVGARSGMGCRWAGSVVSPSASGLRCQAQVAVGCHCPCVATAGDGGWRRPAVAGCTSVVGCPPPLLWTRGTWRGPCSMHFVACRWHGRSTPEQQSSGAAGRRNGAAAGAPGRWSVGALGCWSPGAAECRNVGAVGRQSCGAPECQSGGGPQRPGVSSVGQRSGGAPGCHSSGAPERRCSGTPEQRSTGVSEQQSAAAVERRSVGTVGCRGSGAPGCRGGGVPVWWGAGMVGCGGAGVAVCRDSEVPG